MKNKAVISLMLLVLLFFVSCGEEETNSSSSEEAILGSIQTIPSCIASSTTRGETEQANLAKNVYRPIQDTLKAINEWTKVAREVVIFIEEDLLPIGETYNWTNENPSSATDVARIKWEPSDSEFDTHVEVFYTVNSTEVKGLDVLLTVQDDAAKGVMTFDLENHPNSSGTSEGTAKLTIHFDGTDKTNKTMIFKAVKLNYENGIPKDDEPTKVYAKSWFGDDNIFKVSASYFLPKVKFDDDDTVETAKNRTYTFTATGYDEEGKSSSKKNSAIMKLSIPKYEDYDQTTDDTSTIFTNNSVGTEYKKTIYNNLISGWYADTNVTYAALNALGCSPQLTSEAGILDMTDAQVEQVLNGYNTQYPNTGVGDLLFVTKLVNPAYFSSTGFSGTFDGTTGTLSAVPDWVDSSELKIDDLDSELITPYSVYTLVYDETDFIVE
jgi:hypothetical protein